jgi:hypothetical protein
VTAFKGTEPKWNGNDLDMEQSFFVIGTGGYRTRKDAIDETTGQTAIVNLNAGDSIVLVVGDSRDSYGANSGQIHFRVRVTP